MGTYTVFFANKVGPTGRVVAFEPQNLVHQTLSANMLLNGYRNVQAINGAAYFKDGLVRMDAKVGGGAGWLAGRGWESLGLPAGGGAAAVRCSCFTAEALRCSPPRPSHQRKSASPCSTPAPALLQVPDGVARGKDMAEMVKTNQQVNYGGMSLGKDGELTQARAIDSLGLGNVSFIKIDVQGAEKMVLYGARDTIKRCLPVVNYEVVEGIFGDSWFQKYAAALNVPEEVRSFDVEGFLKGLGYSLGQKTAIDLFWHPPGYAAAAAAAQAGQGLQPVA
jgi:hypothetical protein